MPKQKPGILKCTLCTRKTKSISNLINHMKTTHGATDLDEHQCPLCNYSFDQLWTLGRHLSTCSQNNQSTDLPVFLPTRFKNLEKYRELTNDAAFDFALNLAKNINVPRNSVFEVVEYAKHLLTSISEGVTEAVAPLLKEGKVHEFENIISIMINDCFKNVDTEHKLDKSLSKKQLISAVKQVKLEGSSVSLADKSNTELKKGNIQTVEDVDCDDNGGGSGGNSNDGVHITDNKNSDTGESKAKTETVTLMDISFQLKTFFELPNVFNKTMQNAQNIKRKNKLNHYINGKSWKNKLKNFSKRDIVIPCHLHIDDTQTNNSLGTHTTNGDQTLVYYTVPTIPNEYAAQLDTIFTAMVFQSSLSKDDNNKCYDALVDELNKLADNGLTLDIEGKKQHVFFVMGLLLGDNKGLNECLGFPKGFKANYYCRHCRLRRNHMEFSYKEDMSCLRNIRNYYEDLEVGDMSLTGISKDSAFNRIRYFHATDCCADIMHDVNEGILHYNVCETILHFIKKEYFTLDQLNQEKHRRKYGESEDNNRSGKIRMKDLRRKKFKMTASESHSFVHHLPLLLLNITETEEIRQKMESDQVWEFLLVTIRFLDMCYMTEFDSSSLNTLSGVISAMHEMYVRLFKQTLKPKHHFATHYPSLIKRFGPLRYMSSMRFEAKHKFIKNYTKNTASRKNLSYSIGRKLQYHFAFFLKSSNALQDKFETFKPKLTRLMDEEYFRSILPCAELNSMFTESIYVCDKVKLNGLILSSKLNLPHLNENHQMSLLKIVKILMKSSRDPFSIRVIYQKYAEVSYQTDYASYTVKNLLPDMYVLNISEIICQGIFPVVLHQTGGFEMFRYKTF